MDNIDHPLDVFVTINKLDFRLFICLCLGSCWNSFVYPFQGCQETARKGSHWCDYWWGPELSLRGEVAQTSSWLQSECVMRVLCYRAVSMCYGYDRLLSVKSRPVIQMKFSLLSFWTLTPLARPKRSSWILSTATPVSQSDPASVM